ncbi:ATP-binding protein, partial [Paraburkholderia sp. BR14320]|uniref:ATP-binding protein n=1 Tax=unclassified Paraburkholderia TaxID=2615204 RepID=UPI0034CE8389
RRFRTLARPGASVVRGVFVFFIAQLKNSLPNFNVGLTATEPEDFHDLVAARYERAATILTSNLDLSEWGDAFPDNRILGAATLDRLRHGAYRIVIEGESFRKPKPMPENGENAVAKSGKKPHS